MDDPRYPLVAQYTGVRSLRADNVPLTSANPANGTRDLLVSNRGRPARCCRCQHVQR